MKRLNRPVDVPLLVLVACALTVTALYVRRELTVGAGRPASYVPIVQSDWGKYARAGHVIGDAGAQATIVEFADFECPYCRVFASYTDSLRSLGVRFRVVYRHYPLSMHRFAIPAARASECAAEQGRFATMHSHLFQFADSLGLVSWWWYAKRAGVEDSARFAKCVSASAPIPALGRDTADARVLRIRGTPLLLVGSQRLDGVPSFDSLRAYISRSVK
ncbi:MAG: thioredoxin domain-containing protein [Gemmatimonadota bacterium]|nr:thioredoxin domain-containing protein [Gemmatimonadota bacterium]